MSTPLPVAVIGCGRMGRLHARVYSQMPRVKLVGVVDADADTAAAVASDYNTTAYATAEELPADLAQVYERFAGYKPRSEPVSCGSNGPPNRCSKASITRSGLLGQPR